MWDAHHTRRWGTEFVGRHTVAEFLNHEVTALSRGTVAFGVLEWNGVEHLVADRTADGVFADALDTSVEVVHASERELAWVGLDPDEFVLYHHLGSSYPHVLETCKLASLGWESTPVEVAMARTVAEAVASGRDGSAYDPGREAEARLLEMLTGE